MLTMSLFLCVGYATLSDNFSITGTATVTRTLPDVYITNVTPTAAEGVTVNSTNGTVMFASVNGGGTATFTIDVINISNSIYVFDRVIDGAETNFEGVYSGTDITYELSGIAKRDEIAENGGTLSFDVTITVPEGVTAEYYILNFHFVNKYGIPDEDYFPDDMPDEEISVVQRLADILNNRYATQKVSNSRDYLIVNTIQDRWQPGADPYVGTMTIDYLEPLHDLFGDILDDSSVKFILKNQDLNYDGYKEISLYLTSDILDNETENLRGVVCVYVTVFTPAIDDQGNIVGYNMVCEALRGYCYEVNYGSGNKNPSFSTDEWKDDVGYVVDWIEGIGAIIEDIPDDLMNSDGTQLYKHDYYSYNQGYYYNYWWYNTAPHGNKLWQCLDGKIPQLPYYG